MGLRPPEDELAEPCGRRGRHGKRRARRGEGAQVQVEEDVTESFQEALFDWLDCESEIQEEEQAVESLLTTNDTGVTIHAGIISITLYYITHGAPNAHIVCYPDMWRIYIYKTYQINIIYMMTMAAPMAGAA